MTGLFEPYREFINNSHDIQEQKSLRDKVKTSMDALKGGIKQPYKHMADSLIEESNEKGKAPIPQKEIDKLADRKASPFMILVKIFALIKKDLKLVLRSRSSGLIIFFGPLLLILLVGLAFNTSTLYSLKVASYTPNPNNLTTSVLAGLDTDQYNIYEFPNTEQCQNGVRSGEYHVCIIFSDHFESGASDSKVTYYVDESRVNIAYVLQNAVNRQIRTTSAELSKGFTSDIITVLDYTQTVIDGNLGTVNSLISLNSDSALRLDEAQDNLNSLDLEFNIEDYNFTGIRDAIAYYELKENKSFGKITVAVDDLEKDFFLIEGQFEEAKEQAQKSTQDIGNVKTTVSGASSSLTQLRDQLKNTKSEIQGIEVTDAGIIVEPIKSDVQPLSKENTHLSFLFPTLLVLVVMFISILLSSTVVMKEKNSKAFFRNFINPTGDFLYILGTYLTTVILVILQLLVLLVAALYFRNNLLINIWPLLLTLVIVATVFIFLGMAIGYVFRTEETSILGSIAVATILLLFSNTVLPIESLPSPFREIVNFNPFILAENMVKQILLFNAPLNVLYLDFIYLGVFVIGLFVIAYVGRLISKRRA